MKTLMLGNQAIARGLYEAGCSFVSSYPGTPSTEITEYAAEYKEIYAEWAPNEKVAMEAAFGASLSGARSFCAMKHVGLNVAADPLFTMSYTGVNGGMVIAVADDAGMHSSQNEQDSRHYAIAAKLPMLEPSDSAEALAFTKEAFEISEKFDTPVLIKMCTRIAHCQSTVTLNSRQEHSLIQYDKNAKKYVMMPGYAKLRHPIVETRTKELSKYAETTFLNKAEYAQSEIGFITDSTCYDYLKEIFADTVSILKIGLINPLPQKKITEFASKVKKLYVLEELDPIIEDQVKAMGINVIGKELFPCIGEFSQNLIREKLGMNVPEHFNLNEALPVRPPVMCAGCPHRGMYYAFKHLKLNVLGDIGCYTLGATAPLESLDSTLCMGASVSSLHGFIKADELKGKNTVCVIGDSTFMHSGMTGLVNMIYNDSKATVVILDNSITGMTGHQQNPTTGVTLQGENTTKINLEKLCESLGIKRIRIVDPYQLDECEKVLKEECEANELSVIISRRPCALLKYVKHKKPVSVDAQKCLGCKSCMKVGCPALSMKDKTAVVDPTLCVGCSICTQLCRHDAFIKIEEE